MENSMSSMGKPLSSDDDEESGWTVYFEDFKTNNRDHERKSSSMISDATSSAAKKFNNKAQVARLTLDKSCRQQLTSFKKRKAHKGAFVGDDAFEDTASSPVSSPKVCDLSKMDMNSKEKDSMVNNSEEKGSVSGEMDKRGEFGFIDRESDITELKKKGLCLGKEFDNIGALRSLGISFTSSQEASLAILVSPQKDRLPARNQQPALQNFNVKRDANINSTIESV